MKKILHFLDVVFISPLGFVFLFCFLFWLSELTMQNRNEEFISDTTYYGVINKKEIEFGSKGGSIYFFDITMNENVRYVHSLFSSKHLGLYDSVLVGDTIIKLKGEGCITLKRSNGKIIKFEFNGETPDCK